MLDLTVEPDRPTVRLAAGDYKMRLPEELTFDEFAVQVAAGNAMVEKAADVDQEGVLAELHAMIVKAATVLLIDLDAEAATTITPGQYSKISIFFMELGNANAALPSENG